MKKFFSYFCYVAMAVAAVSFVSCGDDDDEIDEPKKEEEAQTVRVYTAAYSSEILDIYDISLGIYRNGKKQDVALSTANSVKSKGNEYHYYCASVNGEEGVDSVVAVVKSKANIESIVASKDPDTDCDLTCYANIKELKKVANGDYSDHCGTGGYSLIGWGELLVESGSGGGIPYVAYRKIFEDGFSAK